MSWVRFNRRATLTVGVMMLAMNTVHAQTARTGGGASAQLLQQLQQLASERTSLEAENAKLKKDLEVVRKDRDAFKTVQQSLDRRAKTSEVSLKASLAQRESSERELAQTKDKLQQLIGKFRETIQTMRDLESEHTTTKQTLATRDKELGVCIDRNLALYKINQEVLSHLENQSVWTRVAQTEPFTKIKRVQLENLVDDYKERADEQRMSGSSGPTPPSAAAANPAEKEAAPPPAAGETASH
jgi:chromosome segregation ATPase